MQSLHVEYAERVQEYGILFIFSLFCEYVQLEYVRIHVIYRVHQAGYGIPIRVVAPREYVNIYSTRRVQSAKPSWGIAATVGTPSRSYESFSRGGGQFL